MVHQVTYCKIQGIQDTGEHKKGSFALQVMQATQKAATTATAHLRYLIADQRVVVEGFIAAPEGSVVVDLDHLRRGLAQHGLGIVPLTNPARGSSSSSANRCEVHGPDPPPQLSVTLLESAEGPEQPEGFPAGAKSQLVAQVKQESRSSDVVFIEESGPEMSYPRPRTALNKEDSKGQAEQAQQAGAKPQGESMRRQPLKAIREGVSRHISTQTVKCANILRSAEGCTLCFHTILQGSQPANLHYRGGPYAASGHHLPAIHLSCSITQPCCRCIALQASFLGSCRASFCFM